MHNLKYPFLNWEEEELLVGSMGPLSLPFAMNVDWFAL
jgi:hypothetical protein